MRRQYPARMAVKMLVESLALPPARNRLILR
jgi:hypothetical protein